MDGESVESLVWTVMGCLDVYGCGELVLVVRGRRIYVTNGARIRDRRRARLLVVFAAALVAFFAVGVARAQAQDPLVVFTPQPPPMGEPKPPPNGYFNGPCGLAVDSVGRVYVADSYHDAVDVFTGAFGYVNQLTVGVESPCALALDSSDNLRVGRYHGEARLYGSLAGFGGGAVLDPLPTTGIAVDTASDDVYVNRRSQVAVYDSSGTHLLDIGAASIEDGYGIAVSGFAGTAGRVYVPDAATDTVKVYDPAVDTANPAQTIGGPPGGFTSLRDSTVAVDDVTGDVYVVDNTQPANTEQPRARAQVFSSGGAYKGHLKYDVVHGAPTGLAVDNSGGSTQGRVYVTSGNTHQSGIYVYPPNAAVGAAPLAPTIPPTPPGGDQTLPDIPIGKAAGPGSGIACEGDDCQVLPPEPVDPTLTTLLQGLGNPKVRFRRALRNCRPVARQARRLSRRAKRSARRARRSTGARGKRLNAGAAKLRKRARRTSRAAKRCVRSNRGGGGKGKGRGGGRASASASASAAATGTSPATTATPSASGSGSDSGAPSTPAPNLSSLPLDPGFAAFASADGGAATAAGSHPYQLDFALGLDQAGGTRDLRDLRIDLPPGLLANPAAMNVLCSSAAFATPRSSPFEASASGESCPDRSQVGTVEVETGAGGGQTHSFGLFNLDPADRAAAQFGAAPFGVPLVFDVEIRSDSRGTYFSLGASVPLILEARGVGLSLWGVPWDASHNGERGNCLNQAEPAFPWAKCSIGEPLGNRPLAFLTLPTECGKPLAFTSRTRSWQAGGTETEQATSDHPSGEPAPMAGCDSIGFNPDPEGLLSVKKASSSSGFVFRFTNEDSGLINPRSRIRSHVRDATVELPDGVTLNPSLGAGLEACSPGELDRESAFNPHGDGCPNGSKIGSFSIRSPMYEGFLRGSLYLAEPFDNPFDSLVAVYLVAKSADRGILLTAPGEIEADRGDGSLTATFEDLPQLPYSELEVNVRSGQRAPLVSPPRCGAATTRIELEPWSGGASEESSTDTQISSGIDAGPCPDGDTPPFKPGVVAGGVNSNVGSYTPYFVHLTREDDEQEITSYSLTLPKGIVGKLAGIPFCPEAAIARARGRSGFDETARPSCPAASQVGRTETGYGVGAALTYAPGRIYLAGPHNGQPLSLVTVNAATVGPFDLGTIVVRSAFSVDPRTAQLAIDSRASDPIPHIIDGVPLHLRDVRVYMDRPQFTRNPTGCEASQLVSTLTGSGRSFARRSDDSSSTLTEHFQLLNCLTLGFRPQLGLRLRGGTRRGDYPGLRAVFRARGGDADLERIAVTMPKSLFLAQNHIRTVCTKVQFAAEACPPGSIYGRAAAVTPLFDEPLTGPVLLRSSDNQLPDLVASLRAGEVRIVLEGRIGPSQSGGIRAFFEGLPDAPVERFTMWLSGGRQGLLVNSVNICKASPQASVKALAHNNRGAIFTTKLRGQCKQAKKKGKGKEKGGKRKSGKKRRSGRSR
jgi:hypothetical protein